MLVRNRVASKTKSLTYDFMDKKDFSYESIKKVNQKIGSYLGFFKHAKTYKLKEKIKQMQISMYIALIMIFLLSVLSGCSFQDIPNDSVFDDEYYIIKGDSMAPLLEEGNRIIIDTDYYNNHEVLQGDIVAIDSRSAELPIIKIVKANDNNDVEIKDNHLFIDGDILKNSQNQIYEFDDKEIKMLSLYIINRRIPKNSFFVFGDNIHHSEDSRNIGVISKDDIIGKVQYR